MNIPLMTFAAEKLEALQAEMDANESKPVFVLEGVTFVFDLAYYRSGFYLDDNDDDGLCHQTANMLRSAGIECGTAACALGYMTMLPAFNDLVGKKLEFTEGWLADAASAFDISLSEAGRLFIPSHYDEDLEPVMPKHVAARMRAMLAR